MNKKIIIDPPDGWRYGFPKEIPREIYNSNKITEWLVDNGYPQKTIDYLGGSLYYRVWEEEVDNRLFLPPNI